MQTLFYTDDCILQFVWDNSMAMSVHRPATVWMEVAATILLGVYAQLAGPELTVPLVSVIFF